MIILFARIKRENKHAVCLTILISVTDDIKIDEQKNPLATVDFMIVVQFFFF